MQITAIPTTDTLIRSVTAGSTLNAEYQHLHWQLQLTLEGAA